MNLGAGTETGIYQVKDGEIDEYGNYIMKLICQVYSDLQKTILLAN